MAHSKLTYSQRIEAKRARRLHPSPQALAARRRAAQRNNALATTRADMLTTNAANGDAMAAHLLQVTHG